MNTPTVIRTAAITIAVALASAATASAQDFPRLPVAPQIVKATSTLGVSHTDLVVPAGCTKKFAKLTPYAKSIGVKSIIFFSCPADDPAPLAAHWNVSRAFRAL